MLDMAIGTVTRANVSKGTHTKVVRGEQYYSSAGDTGREYRFDEELQDYVLVGDTDIQISDAEIDEEVANLKAKLEEEKSAKALDPDEKEQRKKWSERYQEAKENLNTKTKRYLSTFSDTYEAASGKYQAGKDYLTEKGSEYNSKMAEYEKRLRALTALEVDYDSILFDDETRLLLNRALNQVCNLAPPVMQPPLKDLRGIMDILKNPLLYTHSDLLNSLANCGTLNTALEAAGVDPSKFVTAKLNNMAHKGDAKTFNDALAIYGVKPSEANFFDLGKALETADQAIDYIQANEHVGRSRCADIMTVDNFGNQVIDANKLEGGLGTYVFGEYRVCADNPDLVYDPDLGVFIKTTVAYQQHLNYLQKNKLTLTEAEKAGIDDRMRIAVDNAAARRPDVASTVKTEDPAEGMTDEEIDALLLRIGQLPDQTIKRPELDANDTGVAVVIPSSYPGAAKITEIPYDNPDSATVNVRQVSSDGTIEVHTNSFNFSGTQLQYSRYMETKYGGDVPDEDRYMLTPIGNGYYWKDDLITMQRLPGWYKADGTAGVVAATTKSASEAINTLNGAALPAVDSPLVQKDTVVVQTEVTPTNTFPASYRLPLSGGGYSIYTRVTASTLYRRSDFDSSGNLVVTYNRFYDKNGNAYGKETVPQVTVVDPSNTKHPLTELTTSTDSRQSLEGLMPEYAKNDNYKLTLIEGTTDQYRRTDLNADGSVARHLTGIYNALGQLYTGKISGADAKDYHLVAEGSLYRKYDKVSGYQYPGYYKADGTPAI